MSKKETQSAKRNGELPANVEDVYEAVDAALKDHESAKNSGFKMVFRAGWQRVQRLARKSQTALRLWAYLAEHAGPNGALVITQSDLAKALGVTARTIRTHVRHLEETGALITMREAGGYIYCLNPNEIWALAADQRRFAPFYTRVIFAKHSHGMLSKRLTVATFRADARPDTPTLDRFLEDAAQKD
ncbi:helix-turn-helix domain-containing protein [Parvibaculum sedimenti]|uniref:helix-turn-helix domain-containing protein n=1 Tax=Parvibaculum sedimenti TaxID=2608632 RepID=UPI00163A8FE1|nr:helix-turn-helix domain-containing protein [Parvibaculum sedimenti]